MHKYASELRADELDNNLVISPFQMAIDTIFLCFCEDSERNDGISKPYFMSRGLMVFINIILL
jgi:hypothetical protein